MSQSKSKNSNSIEKNHSLSRSQKKSLQNRKQSSIPKYLNKNNSHFAKYNQQITQLTEKIQQLKQKNTKLQRQLNSQTALRLQYSQNYLNQKQKSQHLEKIIKQIQQQAENAKYHWGKAFRQEVEKIKLLTKMNDTLKEENLKLSSEIMVRDSIAQYQNNPYDKSKMAKRQNISQKSNQQNQQTSQQLLLLRQRLEIFEMKEKSWSQKAKQFTNQIKIKEKKINSLLIEVEKLQRRCLELEKSMIGMGENNNQKNSGISSKSTVSRSGQSNKHLSQYQNQNYGHNNQQNQLKGLKNSLEYVRQLSQKTGKPSYEIYIQKQQYFILDHSNIQIHLQQFLQYDWTLLAQLNCYNTLFSDKKWKYLIKNAYRFPHLETIYLFGNGMKSVKKEEVSQFQRLTQVILATTDEIKSMKVFKDVGENCNINFINNQIMKQNGLQNEEQKVVDILQNESISLRQHIKNNEPKLQQQQKQKPSKPALLQNEKITYQ